jgi:hypothetical protein
MQTNTFCIVCKRWLSDPQLAANRAKHDHNDDQKLIKITFQDGVFGDDTEANTICAIFSCWHKGCIGSRWSPKARLALLQQY